MVAAAVVGSAVVGAVASSRAASKASKAQGKSAKSAAQAQLASTELSIEEQRRQFDEMRKLLQPYSQAGVQALGEQQRLLGFAGINQEHSDTLQRKQIDKIKRSSEYQMMLEAGEDAILQNASATGGLRGGNTQNALMQYRPQLLNQLINQRFNRLGALTSAGQASAAGQAQAGQASANNISSMLGQQGSALANMYQQQGAATAGRYIAQGQAVSNAANSVGTAAVLASVM